jgi:phosphocarrier protein
MNDAAAPGRPVVTRNCEILNKRGLHARAAAKFVKLAGQFAAETRVTKGGTTVSGLSIMGLMMLAAAPGCSVEVSAEGDDAKEAVDALAALIAAKFDEE